MKSSKFQALQTEAARDLAIRLTRGTTTDPSELSILWIGKHLAAVHHKAGSYYGGTLAGTIYVPASLRADSLTERGGLPAFMRCEELNVIEGRAITKESVKKFIGTVQAADLLFLSRKETYEAKERKRAEAAIAERLEEERQEARDRVFAKFGEELLSALRLPVLERTALAERVESALAKS